MTGTDLAVRGTGNLALRGDQLDWTDAQRAALAQIGIAEAPPGDQQVFLHVAQRVGLDPFARQIYLIGRKDDKEPSGKKWTIQTGIDGFRVFSERHPLYGGELGAEWCGEDGVWHDVWVGTKPPVAARFTVVRKDRDHPIRAVAHYSEYVQTKYNGDPNHMWATKPAGQLAKCAEALARRRAFPQDLSSVYTDEEMGHVDNPDWDALIVEYDQAEDRAELVKLWKLARGMRPNDHALHERIAVVGERLKARAEAKVTPDPAPAPPVTAPDPARPPEAEASTQKANAGQITTLKKLLAAAGVKTIEAQLRAVSHAIERDDLTRLDELSADDVSRAITRLEAIKAQPVEQPAGGKTTSEGGQQ